MAARSPDLTKKNAVQAERSSPQTLPSASTTLTATFTVCASRDLKIKQFGHLFVPAPPCQKQPLSTLATVAWATLKPLHSGGLLQPSKVGLHAVPEIVAWCWLWAASLDRIFLRARLAGGVAAAPLLRAAALQLRAASPAALPRRGARHLLEPLALQRRSCRVPSCNCGERLGLRAARSERLRRIGCPGPTASRFCGHVCGRLAAAWGQAPCVRGTRAHGPHRWCRGV